MQKSKKILIIFAQDNQCSITAGLYDLYYFKNPKIYHFDTPPYKMKVLQSHVIIIWPWFF